MPAVAAKAKPITRVSQLIPDPSNANLGTERGNAFIERSIREYGLGRSILLDKKGRIIAGNKTVENAGALGIEEVQVIQTDGKRIIAVQRMDLDMAKDPKARELALADNRAAELNLEWAGDVLAEMGKDIDLSPFFSTKELAAIIGKNVVYGDAPEPELDRADELRKKFKVKTGQLWEISAHNAPRGAHRLLCGDSTNKETVARLWDDVPQDALPVLMVTDPPYGVEYDPNWRNEVDRKNGEAYGARAVGKVSNDDRSDWREAWALFPGDVAYCWHSMKFSPVMADSLQSVGFEIRGEIVWAKSRLIISQGHYHPKHESCWYAVREGKTAHWIGDHSQTTVWEIEHLKSDTGHGTQKPIDCMRRPMVNHEGNVYDPFLGSGTTICAAEQVGRLCFGLELEPGYVGVILQRLSDMGLTPKLAA